MKILFGYRDHNLGEKKWYRILRTLIVISYSIGIIGYGGLILWGFSINKDNIPLPYNLIITLVLLLILTFVVLVSINAIRSIFLFLVLEQNKKDKFKIYVHKHTKLFRVLTSVLLLLMLLLFMLTLSEYVEIVYFNGGDMYPWGCKCQPGMENYANEGVYLFSLFKGMLSSSGSSIALLIFWKKFLLDSNS